MGLGPSIIPHCQSRCCEMHGEIRYVYITYEYTYNELPQRLKPWFNSNSNWDNRSCFWACDGCYNTIGDQYKYLFVYHEEYRINSK